MKLLNICALILLLSCLFCDTPYADTDTEEKLSKIGFIKNNTSNVRAGDNINYEILCKLKKGDPVKLTGKRYSWYKIDLPRKAYVYIKDDYVDLNHEKGEKIGEVNAARVNLRAGPGTKYSILGQVSKPESLRVISKEEGGWYKIEPPQGASGWVHSNQIALSFVEKNEIKEVKKIDKIKEKEELKTIEKAEKKEDSVTVAKKEIPPKIKRKGSETIKLERVAKPSISGGNLTFSNKNK